MSVAEVNQTSPGGSFSGTGSTSAPVEPEVTSSTNTVNQGSPGSSFSGGSTTQAPQETPQTTSSNQVTEGSPGASYPPTPVITEPLPTPSSTSVASVTENQPGGAFSDSGLEAIAGGGTVVTSSGSTVSYAPDTRTLTIDGTPYILPPGGGTNLSFEAGAAPGSFIVRNADTNAILFDVPTNPIQTVETSLDTNDDLIVSVNGTPSTPLNLPDSGSASILPLDDTTAFSQGQLRYDENNHKFTVVSGGTVALEDASVAAGTGVINISGIGLDLSKGALNLSSFPRGLNIQE